MQRRTLLAALSSPILQLNAQSLPDGEPHFPSRLHQYVWRNWDLANLDRMAAVVGAGASDLARIARSLGLPPKRAVSPDTLRRIYITTIRQNWFLLPEDQIIDLLGWDRARFEFTLKEDDFLDVKLGQPKPHCEPLRYSAPTPQQDARAAALRAALTRHWPAGIGTLGQPRFAFIDGLSAPLPAPDWRVTAPATEPVLAAAAARFSSSKAGGRLVTLLPDRDAAAGPGRFRIVPTPAGASIHASSPTDAIRALYRLRRQPAWPTEELVSQQIWSPYFIYSYFALYGDPLMEGDAAGLPDGYLERAADCGVDGIWIQGVLNTLAPSPHFPEFGRGASTRLANLRALVARAARFGLRVYLYLNEPRAMPAAFFAARPGLRGASSGGIHALCSSTPAVLDWLRASVSHVFSEAPNLGGLFTITMSENLTNCFSHGGAWGDRMPSTTCPRCSQRPPADILAELLNAINDGVRAHSRHAAVMAYDWGWGSPLAAGLIPKLSTGTSVISISEWDQPVERGGVKTSVGEYSMSVPGPGPRARRNWALARANEVRTLAKTQFNNTWEISAVPYIPVLPLVLDHCEKLAAEGVNGIMASWTCGGYPSPNLRAASAFASSPRPSRDAILLAEAERIYGKTSASAAIGAWHIFSEAFQSFPYGVAIYVLPLQHGPANLLRLKPTLRAPGMILFPHDAYKAWKGAYPEATVQRLMARLSARWRDGLSILEKVQLPGDEARLELAIARTCQAHFESTANQLEFYLLRDAPRAAQTRARMIEIAQSEIRIARAQFEVARADSRIAYEASNHYYYTPADLLEKILNCEQVIAELRER